MSICTIGAFRTAMQFSDQYISSPRGIRANLATITRSKHFAECEATIGYRQAMIYAPLNNDAVRMIMSTNRAVGRARGDIIAMEVGYNALHTDFPQSVSCPIVVEYLPESYTPLREALYLTRRTTLLRGLEELRAKLIEYDFSHNNLHIDNIVLDENGTWYPIRLYYSTQGAGGDEAAFDALRIAIADSAMSDEISETLLCEELSGYTAEEATDQEPLIENRRRYATERGYGYMDESGAVVIEAQYSYAENFTEGRAVVRNAEHRAGVIDRRGREIVALCYDEAIFDVESATIWVSLDGRWSEFDYNGIATGELRDNAPLCAEES